MISPTPVSDRSRRRRIRTASFPLPVVLSTVPTRVYAHALVVVMCLVVAYAGRTNRLTDQIGFLQVQPDASRPASLPVGDRLATTDTLVRGAIADASGPAPQSLLVTHYETQPGDTVALLADRFGISENTIIWTNNLSLDGQLEPGRELLILPVSGVLYTVQAGETLGDIAQRFQSDQNAIADVNQLANTSQPANGTQLIIPGGRIESDPRSSGAASTSRPNVARTDNAAADAPPAAIQNDPNLRSGFDVSSAVDLIRRLPFVKSIDPAAPAPPGTAPTAPLQPVVYTVADGDTLSAIAAKFGVSADSIAAASGIQGSADALAINQKLVIPPVPGAVHTVQNGDTLSQVAQRYGASESEIVHANLLTEPFVLKVGQVLVVPGGRRNLASGPVQTPAPVQVAGTSYAVQDGDSVATIAQSFGIELQAIVDANGLRDPYLLHPGQLLMIRGATRVVPPAGAAAAAPRPTDSHPSVAAPAAAAPVQTAVPTAPAPVQVAAPNRPAPVQLTTPAVPTPVQVATPAAPALVQAAVAAAPPTPRRAVVSEPAPVPTKAASASGWSLVDVASRYLGTPYVWGGTSPGGFDCSGFIWYVFRRAGSPVPRDLWGQLQSGSHVSRANLEPGDIVFFANTYKPGLSHGGIYMGGGRIISAVDYGVGVAVISLSNPYWSSRYYGATRTW